MKDKYSIYIDKSKNKIIIHKTISQYLTKFLS